MKAMILAAGRGERMRPLTDHTPKPLLEAGGCSLIEWHLVNLARAGIEDIVVNTAWLGAQIEAALGNGDRFGVRIIYSREPTPLETAGGIRQALAYLGEHAFVLLNGDIWSDYPLSRLPAALEGLAHLVLVDNPAHHRDGDFRLKKGHVHPSADHLPALTYSGIAVIDPRLVRGLSRGHRPLGPLLREAAAAGNVSGEYWGGHWHDVGTPERLAALRQLLDADADEDRPERGGR